MATSMMIRALHMRLLAGMLLALAAMSANALALDAPPPASTTAAASESLMPPAPETVLAVPPELRQMVQEHIVAPNRSRLQRAQELTRFLFAENGLDMQYQADATPTVAEAFRTRQANCLGFTLLAVALAREAGLRAYGQELERVMARDMTGDTVLQVTHANAGISAGGRRFVVDVAADELLDAPPPHAVSDAHLLAMYYDNRAMELMMEGKLDIADAWMRAALGQDDRYAVLWNNAGVLASHRGDSADAERNLLHALQLSPKYSAALFNLIGLYHRTGNIAQANAWQDRAEHLLKRDPFHQYVLGKAREKNGDLAGAINYYQRAISLDHHVHQFHFALARAYFMDGQLSRAGAELATASQLSTGANHDAYQAKLEHLRHMLMR